MTDKNKNRRNPTPMDLGNMVYGKIPPQAKELEEAVLGAIMLEVKAFTVVKDILSAEMFYVEVHQRIFKAMCQLDGTNGGIDLLTVVEQLKKNEDLDFVGGPYFVSKLTNSVVSSANIERHSKIIFEKWLMRYVISNSGELINDAYMDERDPFELIQKMLNVNDLVINKYLPKHKTFDALLFTTINNILATGPRVTNGIRSGFLSLDRIIDFFINGLFYVIAARPSMGKTAFMVQLVENFTAVLLRVKENKIMDYEEGIQEQEKIEDNDELVKKLLAQLEKVKGEKVPPIGIIEMETHDEAFIQRMIANVSGVDSRKFKTGNLTEDEKRKVAEAGEYLINKGIICDFNPVSTIGEIRIKAKAWHSKFGIKALLIDYLQYIESDDQHLPRERQVAKISKGLAGLAKELNIPVIAFAQLSREVYKRADKRPIMSDLRESGAIEQDARCIMFLHRPEYYGELEDPVSGVSTVGITEVIVAKNNEGSTGMIRLKMIKELSKFEEVEEDLFASTIDITHQQGQKPIQGSLPGWDKDEPPF